MNIVIKRVQICAWAYVMSCGFVIEQLQKAACSFRPACLHHLLFMLRMCIGNFIGLNDCCLDLTFQAGINLLQDKVTWIKSSWKAIESSREHQRFSDVPLGHFMSIDCKCWVGACLTSFIQGDWFHPATPRCWDLLISQVWNCPERSGRGKVSGSGRIDGRVKQEL